MQKNSGSIDCGARIVLGIVLIAMALTGPKTPWGWIGLVPLMTGLSGFCALYAFLGINTCPAGTRRQS